MFIIPYIRNVTTYNNILVNVIKILTIGGKYLWEEGKNFDINTDILEPNDIFVKNPPKIAPLLSLHYLCEVDTTKTSLNDFYKWDELSITDEETFCWRSYTYLTDIDSNMWLPIPDTTTLSGCKVSDIISAILSQ
jgi:hypothetical protein